MFCKGYVLPIMHACYMLIQLPCCCFRAWDIGGMHLPGTMMGTYVGACCDRHGYVYMSVLVAFCNLYCSMDSRYTYMSVNQTARGPRVIVLVPFFWEVRRPVGQLGRWLPEHCWHSSYHASKSAMPTWWSLCSVSSSLASGSIPNSK